MRERTTWTVTLLAAVSTAGCSSTSHPPSNETTTQSTEAGAGSRSTAAEGGASTDGSAGDAESTDANDGSRLDGVGFDAVLDASSDADSGGPIGTDGGLSQGPPLCDPTHVWSPAASIASVPQAGFGRFGGISADETAIAWTASTGVIYVADRPRRSQPFSSMPSVIDTTSTPVANDRVALGSNGVQLFAVSADRKGFVAFYRPNVGATWAPSAALQFANLAAMASTDGGGQFFEPVLGADGNSFFYLLAPPGGPPVLFESDWDAAARAWTTGVPPANPELASTSATARRRATGGSADGLTLFFFDERTGVERAAWRDARSSPFVMFVDVPGMTEAAPNYRCDTLYFQERATDSSPTAGAAIAQ
jgi:hypothetical protein